MMKKFSAVAILATASVSNAASPSVYNDKCFHCIDDGHVFCSDDGKEGTCIAATCAETQLKLDGDLDAFRAAYGSCNLDAVTCDTGSKMSTYSDCYYVNPEKGSLLENGDVDVAPVIGAVCPSTIMISQKEIA